MADQLARSYGRFKQAQLAFRIGLSRQKDQIPPLAASDCRPLSTNSEGDIMYDESRHIAVRGFVAVNVGGGVASSNKVQWWSHYPVEESFFAVPTGSALTITDVAGGYSAINDVRDDCRG